MSLDFLGKTQSINTLVFRNRVSQSFEIFDFKVEVIEGIIDSLVILALDALEPFNDNWKVSVISQLKDYFG